mgnify:CR=1 FL=1
MFSGQAFSEFAFGEQEYTPLDTSEFQAFLDEITSPRCWLLELDAFPLAPSGAVSSAFGSAAFGELGFSDASGGSSAGVITLRFSTHGYTSQAADAPANTWYDGRLNDPVIVDRRITGRDGIGGLASVYAEVSLINVDGSLDELLTQYALDGRRARVLIGRTTDALADYGLVFSGVLASAVIGLDTVRLRLSDGAAKLTNTILNENAYLGTGALEGGADIEGKPKPMGYGHGYGIPAQLVDSAKLIYQVHDGLVSSVPNAQDRGIELTLGSDYSSIADLNATAPSAGTYRVCKDASGSYFRLNSAPAGTVTCDALLDASLSGYVNTVSDIVLRILVEQVGLISTEIEPSSFVQLDTDAPAEVGVWVGTGRMTAAQLVDQLLASIGAFGGFNRQGAFSVGMITVPSGVPVATFTEEDIVEITREPLPAAVAPIIWRASVAYQKNYTVQKDLAAAVIAARRTFAAEEVRVSMSDDLAIQSRHLLAVEYANDAGLYALAADADTEALRLFTLWSAERAMYRMKTRLKGMTCDLGKVIQIEHSRHGLAAGKPARVLGHTVRGAEVEMLVLC